MELFFHAIAWPTAAYITAVAYREAAQACHIWRRFWRERF